MKSYSQQLNGKTILITGGTGSLGQALTKRLLKTKVKTIRILSRNENKQFEMESEFQDKRLRFLVGDIRDLPRLYRAFENVDIVFHAAALKHVPVVEYNPFEGIKTNVIGSQNVADACLHEHVKIAVAVGTDKAVSPLNTYGATKLLMEKLFVSSNSFTSPQKRKTKFIAVRYGNVLGSSGSVLPKFINMAKNGQKISITDNNMTRFSLTMDEALDFILDSTFIGKGSEVFIPKLRSYSIIDLKNAVTKIFTNPGEKQISIRPGEKLHETLINFDETRYTWEFKDKYVLFNPLTSDLEIKKNYPGIKKAKFSESYSSNMVKKIPQNELKEIIKSKYL
ncbi:polysaccharide biosynthesis protein [Nitrosopumilus sp.]|nr:polysaccharide biosynthesis protein [Nitrosopumilus sp.]